MAGLRRPPLYRASRYVGIAATLVLVILVVYVGAAVYSASQFRPNGGDDSGIASGVTTGGFEISTEFNFTNPGFLPVDRVQLSAVLEAPDNTSLLASGSSPNVSVAPAAVGHIPLTLLIPFGALDAASALLTQDEVLPTVYWANLTFAHLFQLGLRVNSTVDWGAPFDGLNVSLGAPTETNGTAEVPVSISFQDEAPFADDGALDLLLTPPGDADCALQVPPLDLAVPSHGSESTTELVPVTPSCRYPAGTTLTGRYVSSSWTASLPSESLP